MRIFSIDALTILVIIFSFPRHSETLLVKKIAKLPDPSYLTAASVHTSVRTSFHYEVKVTLLIILWRKCSVSRDGMH